MATVWERAAHSVGHMFFFLVFKLFVILVISLFGFEDGILVPIVPVPGPCVLDTYTTKSNHDLM